jgi:UDP-N-acetylmuramate--alanine ligase
MAKRHLIGVGGVGMSALATALVRLGDEVTGADRTLGTKNIEFLESLGIRCFPDDGSGIDAATDEVIVSTAIESDNPGLLKAKELGIPVTHRARALARTLSGFKLVAVVGTCGKSTVTAMLGHVLAECGLDPFCVNGANVPGWEGAVRVGRGAYAVAEVDESDKSLVAFRPDAAIVTNASADHYSKDEMDEVFDAFVKDCPGPVVDGRQLAGEELVSIPGRHNRNNAFLALRMALALGCDEAKARAALTTFNGVERRLQRYGTRVYDDYAHNPEKLKAMWTTVAEAHPDGGICVVWRPHGYAPLRKMTDALAEMFRDTIRPQDRLLLLPVYDAGGTTDRSVNSEALAEKLNLLYRGTVREADVGVELVADLDGAYRWIAAHRGEFAAYVTCGARDPGLPGLARRIADLA